MMFVFLLQQQTPSPQPQGFDISIVWRTLAEMVQSFLVRLPYIAIGVVVFLAFWIIARVIRRLIIAAGERTRLDLTLADLLSRLASAIVIILGIFVAAMVIFPAFKARRSRHGPRHHLRRHRLCVQGHPAKLLRGHPHSVAAAVSRRRPDSHKGLRRHGRRDQHSLDAPQDLRRRAGRSAER